MKTSRLQLALAIFVSVAVAAGSSGIASAQVTHVHTYTCEVSGGREVLRFVTNDWNRLEEAVYLERMEPRILQVEEFYLGGIVIAMFARYSPALSTRLEIYRPQGQRDEPFRGQFWPIGSSGSWPVQCHREHSYRGE